MSTVTDLETKVRSLRSQLSAAEDSLHRARMDDIGIHEGDIVDYKGGKAKVEKVLRFVGNGGKPWIRGYLQRKNGEWGTLARALYDDWSKP